MPGPARRRAGARVRLTGTALVATCALGLPAVAHGQASTYFRAASSASSPSASTLTLPAPANVAIGDLLIMQIDTDGGTTAGTVPSGWTSIYSGQNAASGGGWSIVAWKAATATDQGASYAVALGKTRTALGHIAAYAGVNTTSPFENTFSAGTNPNGGTTSTSMTYATAATTVANSMVVLAATAFPASTPTTITRPAGTNERLQASVSGASPMTGDLSDVVQAATGSVGRTGTIGSSSGWGTVVMALRPATTGQLQFATAPDASDLGTLSLNGSAQTMSAALRNFAVDDTTAAASGWNVTVQGDASAGHSAVFAQYCPTATCTTDTGPGYVTGGATLPAGSLTLSSSGGSWATSGGSGAAPAFACASGTCALDAGSATKVAAAAAGAGQGPWASSGLSASSLTLHVPTTTRAFTTPGETYHVDLLWTLSSGP